MDNNLNLKQEAFIQNYLNEGGETFGNKVKSYAQAYGLDLNDRKQYKTASANADRLLENARISNEINARLSKSKITSEFISSQLYFLACQWGDLKVKIRALETLSKVFSLNDPSASIERIVYIPVGDYAKLVQEEHNKRADLEFPVDPE